MPGNNERISTDQVLAIANELDTYNKRLNELTSDGKGFFEALTTHWTGEASQKSFENFSNFANRYKELHEKTLNSYIEFLKVNVSQGYEETESDNINLADAYLGGDGSGAVAGGTAGGSGLNGNESSGSEQGGDGGFTSGKVEGSVLEGKLEGATTVGGVATAGSVSGSVLSGEAGYDVKVKSGVDEDGNLSLSAEGSAHASGAIAKGEAKGNFGIASGEIEGEVGSASAKGEAKCTLMDHGEFAPSLSASAEAEAAVAKGSAEAQIGNDAYNVHGEASGKVLSAEAKSGADIGSFRNEDGKQQYGAHAGAGAMASLAQGEVKGGISVFGIDVDVKAKGYAGAVGAEVDSYVTNNGAMLDLDLGLIVGAGAKVSVDWTDFAENLVTGNWGFFGW